jgi:valyl-tRNA synthetase
VLDTWFSSWLWPFATMGWPEQTETLKKFYPTTDPRHRAGHHFLLGRAHDHGRLRVHGRSAVQNVYFTGIIATSRAARCPRRSATRPTRSNSSPSTARTPLRFGTMRSAPLGQDVLFDEKDVELGRNFCNKLWNACRFPSDARREAQSEINPSLLTNDDKWILLKLSQAIKEIHCFPGRIQIQRSGGDALPFFWSEYCDWYLEASKAVLSRPTPDPPRRGTRQRRPQVSSPP